MNDTNAANILAWRRILDWSYEIKSDPLGRWNLLQSILSKSDNSFHIRDELTQEEWIAYAEVFGGLLQDLKIHWLSAVSFEGQTFKSGESFYQARFELPMSFRDCTFEQDADFREAKFYKNTTFDNCTFEGEAMFTNALFRQEKGDELEPVSFRRAVFNDLADFHLAQVEGPGIQFDGTRFLGRAIFRRAKFSAEHELGAKEIGFENTVFEEGADFRDTEFHHVANFSDSEFRVLALFEKTKFYSSSMFVDGTMDAALFDNCLFAQGTTNLDGASLSRQGFLTFNNCKGLKVLSMKGFFSDGKVTFDTLEEAAGKPLTGGVEINLSNATFTSHPPKLIGFDLSERSNFEGIRWPPGAKSREDAADDIHSYERLRGQMERLGAKEVRKLLVNRELACRTALATGWDRIAREIYGAVSGYGQSIERPTKVLLAHWLVVVGTWLAYVATGKTTLSGFDAIGYNISRLFPMTTMRGFHTEEYLDGIRNAPQVLHFLSGTVSVFSPILIFLIALGLRNRFRMAD